MYDRSDSVGLALALTTISGLSTGIGGAIAFFIKKPKTVYLSLSLSFSGGVMLYISFVVLLPYGINGVGELWCISAFFIGIKLN